MGENNCIHCWHWPVPDTSGSIKMTTNGVAYQVECCHCHALMLGNSDNMAGVVRVSERNPNHGTLTQPTPERQEEVRLWTEGRAKAAAEIANQTIARVWYDGIDLVYNGVNLADAITYDVLNVLSRAWMTDASKKAEEKPNG